MWIKGITDEDFINYKVPSMFIATATCSFKCDKEFGQPVCQNGALAKQPDLEVSMLGLLDRYQRNPISRAIVFGGLEPFDDPDVMILIGLIRAAGITNDIVIYTGYNRDEIEEKVNFLGSHYSGIVIKFGRYIPGQKPHFDPVLGVNLASDNQYAERIS